jgi:hypothetical protein
VSQVKHEELVCAPCPLAFSEDAAQQVDVALGVKHDHHLTATDVLGDQQFGQARLAHPRRAQHQRVTNPFGEVHPDVGFIRLDTVDRRIAAQANGCGHLRTQSREQASEQALP